MLRSNERYIVPRESNCANVLLVFIRPQNFFRKFITFSQWVISKVYCLWQESILADFCFRKGFKLLKFLQKKLRCKYSIVMFDWFLAKLEKMLCRGSCCDHKVWGRFVTPYAVALGCWRSFLQSPNPFTLFCTVTTKRIEILIIWCNVRLSSAPRKAWKPWQGMKHQELRKQNRK